MALEIPNDVIQAALTLRRFFENQREVRSMRIAGVGLCSFAELRYDADRYSPSMVCFLDRASEEFRSQEEDAERYRHIRERMPSKFDGRLTWYMPWGCHSLDEAVDASRGFDRRLK